MTIEQEKINDLLAEIEAIKPHLVDCWQITAIVESLGYTDNLIEQEFGFPDALSLSKYVYSQHQHKTLPNKRKSRSKTSAIVRRELGIFWQQFIPSFVYTIPFLSILLLEKLPLIPKENLLPSSLISLFTLATMASLITSGGFVQTIARRGAFYRGLELPAIGRIVCFSIFCLGLFFTIILALLGLFYGFYRGWVADEYLILGTGYYLVLSSLWMLFAILSLRWRWLSPFILLSLMLTTIFLCFYFDIPLFEAQIIGIIIAIIFILVFTIFNFLKTTALPKDLRLPSLGILAYLLFPYFAYGFCYFTFLFLDRFIAGFAINPVSGIIFAINSEYQKNMDLALLVFLLLVPPIEYLSYKFINYWFDTIKMIPAKDILRIKNRLYCRYLASIILVAIIFAIAVYYLQTIVFHIDLQESPNRQIILANIGYFCFVIGLFNSIILFSLNLPLKVIQSLFPALLINAIFGYILANLVNAYLAVVGLLLGAIVFTFLSTRQIIRAIKQPDYVYYLGGY